MTELVKTLQNSSDEELKPCPFCNAPAKYFRGFGDTWGVECTFCEVYKGGYDTKEIATERWNRRTRE